MEYAHVMVRKQLEFPFMVNAREERTFVFCQRKNFVSLIDVYVRAYDAEQATRIFADYCENGSSPNVGDIVKMNMGLPTDREVLYYERSLPDKIYDYHGSARAPIS